MQKSTLIASNFDGLCDCMSNRWIVHHYFFCARIMLVSIFRKSSTQLSRTAFAPRYSFGRICISGTRKLSVLRRASKMKSELSSLIDFKLNHYNSDNNAMFIEHLLQYCGKKRSLPKEFVTRLLEHSSMHQRTLPNVLSVQRTCESGKKDVFDGIVTIVGDVHGQFSDFTQIFQDPTVAGYPSEKNQFVFNGDMVDRGPMGVEIVMTLLVCKLLCPKSVHMLRGNHETLAMTKHYGFEQEVLKKYDANVLAGFRQFFNTLPLAAVVQDTVFVTHGGIGPDIVNMTIQDINTLDRFQEPKDYTAQDQLLWSDPRDDIMGTEKTGRGGVSFCFGPDITEKFLALNKLSLLIRSHEVKQEGYAKCHNDKCWTVFSAPKYCGYHSNLGALVRFVQPDSMEASIVQFKGRPSRTDLYSEYDL